MKARGLLLAALALGSLLAGRGPAEEDASRAVPEKQEEGKPGGLTGKWYRKVANTQITLDFHGERLHVSITGEVSYSAHADYRLTQDRVVFGIITSNLEEG